MRLLLAAAAVALAGCTTVVPVGMSTDVDPQTAPSCARACQAVGMRVAAIVFIRNMGGCVCEPAPGSAAAPRAEAGQGGASAVQMGGAVVVLMEEQAAQQQQQATTTGSSTGTGAPAFGHR
jgi:cytosine/adenosine deaminase-related metal-dependent hydrolase